VNTIIPDTTDIMYAINLLLDQMLEAIAFELARSSTPAEAAAWDKLISARDQLRSVQTLRIQDGFDEGAR